MNIEEKILTVMRHVFNDDSIDASVSRSTCKAWDDINNLVLAMQLEKTFDFALEPQTISGFNCFDDVRASIHLKLS